MIILIKEKTLKICLPQKIALITEYYSQNKNG